MAEGSPVAIRYPRGHSGLASAEQHAAPIVWGEGELLREGKDIAIIGIGTAVNHGLGGGDLWEQEGHAPVTVFNARFAKPLPEKQILDLAVGHERLLLMEENVLAGGFASAVLELLNAALTNTPAVDGMEEVLLAAASLMAAHLTTEGQTEMDVEFLNELLSNLRWMLNLPTASTKEEIMAELQKIITMISSGQGTAAASVSLLDILNQNAQSIADLTAKLDTPDPAKWVSVEVMHSAVQQATERAGAGNTAALATQQAEALIRLPSATVVCFRHSRNGLHHWRNPIRPVLPPLSKKRQRLPH